MVRRYSIEKGATLACPACREELLDCARRTDLHGLWTVVSEGGGVARSPAGVRPLPRSEGRACEGGSGCTRWSLTPDLQGLAEAYYAITDDVLDARRGRFLRHIAGAEARAALAARLPREGQIREGRLRHGGLLVPALRSGRSIEGVDIASRWLVVARRRLTDRGLSGPLVAASAERLAVGRRPVRCGRRATA